MKQWSLKRTISVICMAMMLTLCVFSSAVQAKSPKGKMTVYDNVIKSGKCVYCCDGYRIYRVNLKTGKVKNLVKKTGSPDEAYFAMKKKGKYIYCQYDMQGDEIYIYRVKTNGKKVQKLNKERLWVADYWISGKKLYYSGRTLEDIGVKRVMNLNGTSLKKSKLKCNMKRARSNVKGYRVIIKYDENDSAKTWLKKPDGEKIPLGNYECQV